MLGANIDPNASISSSALILEAEMLSLAQGTIIHDEATLFCHTFQRGRLEFKPLTLGEKCNVGELSVVLPGENVGECVVLQPLTQVLPEETLSSGVYGGSPAQWLAPC